MLADPSGSTQLISVRSATSESLAETEDEVEDDADSASGSAASHFGDAPAYCVDCLAVLQVYRRGRKWATAGMQLYASIWNQIFTAWDDSNDVELV